VYFVDTSALVKFYLPEQGSDTVQEAFRRLDGSLSISELIALETLSAFTKKRRAREIAGAVYVRARDDLLNDLRTRLYLLPIPESAFAGALGMCHTYQSRGVGGNDFLHLATAEYLQSLIPEETVSIMCSDRRLVTLARERGFDVFDPESDDLNDLLPPALHLQ
jgi:predicted nucleic acid-binding protein